MKLSTFLKFVAPSFFVMLVFVFSPLVGAVWLSVHQEGIKTETIKTIVSTPMFGGKAQKQEHMVTQAILDENGNPQTYYEYIGMDNFTSLIRPDKVGEAWDSSFGDDTLSLGDKISSFYHNLTAIEFWGALEFTLLFIFVTLPAILIFGFIVAWCVHTMFQRLRGVFVFISLLPFIITPVVGALSIYWLFLDDAIVAALMEKMGFEQFYFLSNKLTIRTLIIFYGIWQTLPFAFIVLFAGLQSVPQDSIESAEIDGATMWHKIRFVVIPHLMPLFVFITLIHVMDAYRVFEPILVFGSALFADSLQHLTYFMIAEENNYNKAAASGLLTIVGIVVLLIPVLKRIWKEQKGV